MCVNVCMCLCVRETCVAEVICQFLYLCVNACVCICNCVHVCINALCVRGICAFIFVYMCGHIFGNRFKIRLFTLND